MILSFLAWGHGGEDHGAPAAAAVTVGADSTTVSASSSAFEAVLRVPHVPAGAPTTATLLLADWATSAPIEGAQATLTLSGPGEVNLAFASPSPGRLAAPASFPADGDYAGALVVQAPSATDLLAINGLHVGVAAPPATAGKTGAALSAALAFAIGGIGYLLGRLRGAAAAAALLFGLVGARGVLAHGGESHAAPAAGGNSGDLTMRLESQFLVGLRTARLVHEPFRAEVPVLGRFVTRPGGSATLRAPVAGELVAPPAGFPAPGTLVRAGQILGSIREQVGSAERADVAQGRQQAATTLAEARARVALAERDAAAVGSLGAGLSDRERLERAQSLTAARAALEAAERSVASIGDGTVPVRAPVDGRLGATLARPGDQLAPGDEIFRVVDASGLWMEANLPERLAPGVRAGVPARVFATSLPRDPLLGLVLDAGQEADPETGSLTITLAVEAEGRPLRPGMSATAWLGQGDARDALVVPDAAVLDSNGATIAFVKVAPERFELRDVRLGARSGQAWEVVEGLKAGERVVVEGTYSLRSLAGR
jgi:cobalt-zinc-cadmium efflux system membrane fusion protein